MQSHRHYQKWLRYYLDFFHKHHHINRNVNSLAPFIRKLHEKNQGMYQQKQASNAVDIYYDLYAYGQKSNYQRK